MSASTDWKEHIPSGEAELHERLALKVAAIQTKKAAGGAPSRALHAKAPAGVEAELTVLPDLPDELRQGLFAAPATYKAYVRVSNGSSSHQHDKVADVRGFAIKVLGVPGKKIIPGMEDAQTQDFLLIHTPVTSFKNASEFVDLLVAVQNPALALPKLLLRFGLRTFGLLSRLTAGIKQVIHSVATTPYYSALPIKYGPYAARLAIVPSEKAPPGAERCADIGAELAQRLSAGPLGWELQVQLYSDERNTPIEDPSVDWNTPFRTVARLTLPRQDTASPRGQKIAELIERLSFDPWHALVEHRPLGDMMRARNAAYRLSTKARGAAKEPDGTELA